MRTVDGAGGFEQAVAEPAPEPAAARDNASAVRAARAEEPRWRPRLAHLATAEFLAVLCALGFVGPG